MQPITPLIQDMGQILGIAALHMGEDGFCALQLRDCLLNLYWEPEDNTLLVYSVVARAQDHFAPEILEQALTANLFGRATLGMHLGYYAPTHTLALSGRVAVAGQTAQTLADYARLFADQARRWQQTLAVSGPTTDAPAAASQADIPLALQAGMIKI